MPIAPEDRHRYPEHWVPVIRPAILRRARLRCECVGECGRDHAGRRCPELHLRRAVWSRSRHVVILTIAHLDHTPETEDPDRLRAMCQGCHLHYDRDHHTRSEIARWQRALEQAGQDTLFELGTPQAWGENESCPPDAVPANWPEYGDELEWLIPAPGRATPIEATSVLSVLALPRDELAGLDAAIAMHAEWEAAGELVRRTLAGALAPVMGRAQTNELARYAGLTKPRMYRLLEQAPSPDAREVG